MTAGASGSRGWRPLLDGPLFGTFGVMGMDGSVTPRAEMAGALAYWTNSHPEIWKSRPVKGDVGIVYLQEANDFNSVQSGLAGGLVVAPQPAEAHRVETVELQQEPTPNRCKGRTRRFLTPTYRLISWASRILANIQ
jgi:hypothetical protein